MPGPADVAPARAVLSRDEGRLRWTSSPPVVLRRTGPDRVHLVQVGGGPLGGDRLAVDVDLGPQQDLEVRAAAATVVQPGREGGHAAFDVRLTLARGSHLRWRPEPTVVCDDADWRPRVRADVADGAGLELRDQLVLGRAGQRGGRASSGLGVRVGGRALLASTTVVDLPDAAGEEPDVTWAWTTLDGPGVLLTALGTVRGVARVLDAADRP